MIRKRLRRHAPAAIALSPAALVVLVVYVGCAIWSIRISLTSSRVLPNDNFVGRTEERKKHFRGVTVKRGGRIGAGSVILPGKTIGEDALVGAGSVVTADVPPRTVVYGSPARAVRAVPAEQLLEQQGWSDEV